MLDAFSARFPGQAVTVLPEPDRSHLLEMLMEGVVDAAVLLDVGDALGDLGFTAPRGDLDYLDVREVGMVTVADPANPMAQQPVSRAMLRQNAVLLGQEQRCSYWMATQHWLGPNTPLIAVGGVPQIKEWAREGRGVAVLPDFTVRDELDAGILRQLEIETPPLRLRLVWRRGEDTHRPALRDLLYAISGL